VNRREPIDSFNLEKNLPCNNDIYSLLTEQLVSVVDREGSFGFVRNSGCCEFDTDRPNVDSFEQSWTKSAMNCNAASNNAVNQVLEFVIEPWRDVQHMSSFV